MIGVPGKYLEYRIVLKRKLANNESSQHRVDQIEWNVPKSVTNLMWDYTDDPFYFSNKPEELNGGSFNVLWVEILQNDHWIPIMCRCPVHALLLLSSFDQLDTFSVNIVGCYNCGLFSVCNSCAKGGDHACSASCQLPKRESYVQLNTRPGLIEWCNAELSKHSHFFGEEDYELNSSTQIASELVDAAMMAEVLEESFPSVCRDSTTTIDVSKVNLPDLQPSPMMEKLYEVVRTNPLNSVFFSGPEQLSLGWFEAKFGILTGTDVHIVTNGQHRTKLMLGYDKRHKIRKEYINNSMLMGIQCEDHVRLALEKHYGFPIMKPSLVYAVNEHEKWLGASPDGIAFDVNGEAQFCVEIKTRTRVDTVQAAPKKAEMTQIQTQMACTGLKFCHYCQYCPDSKTIIVKVIPFSRSWWSNARPTIHAWWFSNILNKPEFDDEPIPPQPRKKY